MKILDRFLFRQLLHPFFMGLAGFVVLLSVDPLNRALSNIIMDRIPPDVVLRWFLYRLPQDMVLAFPMSTLLASLLVFARLSREGEMTAFKAGGIGFFRMMVPVAFFACFSTLLTFLFNEFVIPISAIKRNEIRKAEMLGEAGWENKNNVVLRTGPDELTFVKRVNPREGKISHLMLFRFSDFTCLERVSARAGDFAPDKKSWILKDVFFARFDPRGRLLGEDFQQEYQLPLSAGITDLSRDYDNPQEQSMRELWNWINYFERNPSINLLPLKVEFFAKSSLPFSCFIFILIGSSLGLSRVRSGGFVGFGISVVIVFLYYVLLTISLSLGRNGFLPPHLAAWLPNFIFFGLGLYLVDDANIQK